MVEFKNGDNIIIGTLIPTELQPASISKGSYPHFTALIEITNLAGGSSGIQFRTGEAPDSNSRRYQVGDKLVISFFPNGNNIFALCNSITDSFSITF